MKVTCIKLAEIRGTCSFDKNGYRRNMKQLPTTPWHKESYDRLLSKNLPELLAKRIPLVGYQLEDSNTYACKVTISISNEAGMIEITCQLPQPDEQGIFQINGETLVVVPQVMDDDLASAEVLCAGEMLYAYVDAQLGEAPENLPWDANLLKAWLPLDQWFDGFFKLNGQILDQTNWLAEQRHLRAIVLPNRKALIAPGHVGRACPFETPEGPNIGRVLRVALGATIRNGKIIVVDDSPEAGLGMTASMIPLLEHDDPNRLLMGANMMGQWIAPPNPEPAFVQTGFEPNAPNFWCGRNLLTAFISWGGDTIEDGIVISESAAKRLNTPRPAEPGDKISNRHGIKGVISRVLPDDAMPHLADGTPVELLCSFMGIPGRLNFGPIREALWGRIAQAEGSPVITPPFNAPSEAELRKRMVKANIPESGMEVLMLRVKDAAESENLTSASTVGWVYWGKTVHLAKNKLMGGADAPLSQAQAHGLQRQAELEYRALRDAAAFENILETYSTRAARNEKDQAPAGLSSQILGGEVQQATQASPQLKALQDRLAAAGIQAVLEDESLKFIFAPPQVGKQILAKPVRHPWLWEHQITEVGMIDSLPEYAALAETNNRLSRMLESNAPMSLIENAYDQLRGQVDAYFAALLTPKDLRFQSRVQFSGRALIVPGPEFRLDEIGLAEELAWRFFGPQIIRLLGNEDAVQSRRPEAVRALDEAMSKSWIIINRAPSLTPTAILAFHPVRIPGNVLRINPLLCPWLNADFDGDQAAVFLPLTKAGQAEAGERLSVYGHLKRDPELVRSLVPTKASVWGLAKLSLTPQGQDRIKDFIQVSMPDGYLTQATLEDAMVNLLMEKGVEDVTETLYRLADLGFSEAKKSGASVPPFIGESLKLPPCPEDDHPEAWRGYFDQISEQIASRNDFDDPDLGAHLLAVKSRKRIPPPQAYTILCATRGVVSGSDGDPIVIRNSQRSGLTPAEMQACVVGSREGLARVVQQWEQPEKYATTGSDARSFNALARARRAQRPGMTFARAAAIREVDPLTDLDSRLFVGIRPRTRDRV
jgi:hypothetical protein